jgi:hypothetical protein
MVRSDCSLQGAVKAGAGATLELRFASHAARSNLAETRLAEAP